MIRLGRRTPTESAPGQSHWHHDLIGWTEAQLSLTFVESTEPKQVFGVKLDFVSERTIKDHHHQRQGPSDKFPDGVRGRSSRDNHGYHESNKAQT